MTTTSKFNPGDIVTITDSLGETLTEEWRVTSPYLSQWDDTRSASNLESTEASRTKVVWDQYLTLVKAVGTFTQADIDKAVTDAIVALTEKANAHAEELGLCSDYDSFISDLGLPPRPKTFRCFVPVGVTVSMTITADNVQDAIAKATAAVTKATFSDFPVDWFRIGESYGTKTQVYQQ